MSENRVIEFQPRGLRSADAAKYLGVSQNTLKDWRWRGIGPSYQIIQGKPNSRGTVLYTVEDLDAYIDSLEKVVIR